MFTMRWNFWQPSKQMLSQKCCFSRREICSNICACELLVKPLKILIKFQTFLECEMQLGFPINWEKLLSAHNRSNKFNLPSTRFTNSLNHFRAQNFFINEVTHKSFFQLSEIPRSEACEKIFSLSRWSNAQGVAQIKCLTFQLKLSKTFVGCQILLKFSIMVDWVKTCMIVGLFCLFGILFQRSLTWKKEDLPVIRFCDENETDDGKIKTITAKQINPEWNHDTKFKILGGAPKCDLGFSTRSTFFIQTVSSRQSKTYTFEQQFDRLFILCQNGFLASSSKKDETYVCTLQDYCLHRNGSNIEGRVCNGKHLLRWKCMQRSY